MGIGVLRQGGLESKGVFRQKEVLRHIFYEVERNYEEFSKLFIITFYLIEICQVTNRMHTPKTGRELASDFEDKLQTIECCPNCGHDPCCMETFTYEYVNTQS